jgi:hypothetical protein
MALAGGFSIPMSFLFPYWLPLLDCGHGTWARLKQETGIGPCYWRRFFGVAASYLALFGYFMILYTPRDLQGSSVGFRSGIIIISMGQWRFFFGQWAQGNVAADRQAALNFQIPFTTSYQYRR